MRWAPVRDRGAKVLVPVSPARITKRLWVTKKRNPSRAARQQHARQRIGGQSAAGGSQRKGRPDVCGLNKPGIDHPATRLDQWNTPTPEKRRVAITGKCAVSAARVADNRRHDRLPIRCPGRIAPQCERIGQDCDIASPSLSIMYSSVSAVVFNRESDTSPLWCNGRPSNIRECALLQISRVVPRVKRPNALPFPSPRYVQKKVRTSRGVTPFAATGDGPPAAVAAVLSPVSAMCQTLVRSLAIVATRRAPSALAASDV